jgi:PhzF family phenazine biosynthesis protein
VRRRFRQIDVFGSAPFTGNGLAVVLDGEGLSDAEMQSFARWTNLAETTFVTEPDQDGADYRVRIFTQTRELPFAGHPTIGTCHAWLEARGGAPAGGRIVQQCEAGLIALRVTDQGLAFAAPPLRRSGPLEESMIAHIAQQLRIERSAIVAGAWADNGPGWAVVMLPDADAVLAIRPGLVEQDLGVVGPHPPGGPADFEVRAFTPVNGATAEDPVTGSLNAGVAQWLLSSGRAASPYTVRQGTAIDHDGRLWLSEDGEGVWVAGAATTYIAGEVEI